MCSVFRDHKSFPANQNQGRLVKLLQRSFFSWSEPPALSADTVTSGQLSESGRLRWPVPCTKFAQYGRALITAHALVASVTISSVDIRSFCARQVFAGHTLAPHRDRRGLALFTAMALEHGLQTS